MCWGASPPFKRLTELVLCTNSFALFVLRKSAPVATGLPALAPGAHYLQPPRHSQGRLPEEDELARCVLNYLAEHPQATDTIDGIAEWWVMREQVRKDVELLQRVLRRLTQQGFLEEIHGGAQVRYSLKKQPNGNQREEPPCQD